MLKNISFLVILCCLVTFLYAQEEITITTYYPSPFGSYRELETETLFFRETTNGLISFNDVNNDNIYNRRLRITAGESDTQDNDQGASIDLHGNAAGGRLDLVAGRGGYTSFWTSPAGTPEAERVRITGAGNVGIGTTSPQTKLQINSWGHGIINTVSQANRTYDIMWYDYGDPVQSSPLPPHTNYRWDLTYRGSDNISVPNGQHEIFLQKGTADGGSAVRAMTWWTDGRITGHFGNYHVSSDIRLKKDIITIPDALEKVLALRGVNFRWKDPDIDQELHIGMIAQEAEKIVPELVYTANDEIKTKSVEYEYVVALLVEAIKEQQIEIENLKKLIK